MSKWFYFLVFLFATVVFLTHYSVAGQAIYGDGIDYWAYLPSVYFDHDLDFTNQYTHTYDPINNNRPNPNHAQEIQKTHRTLIGRVDNPHPPGTALFWLPAFVTADITSLIVDLPRNSYAHLYQLLAGLTSLIILIFGLKLTARLAFLFVSDRRLVLLATVGIFLATPLLYYGSYDIINSHPISFCLNALFWYLLLSPPRRHLFPILGLVIGGATLARLQDAFLLIPAIIFIYSQSRSTFFRRLFTVGGVWVLCLTPLFITWYSLYGIPLPQTYLTIGHIYRGFAGSLFHHTNGLFSRTPLLLLSLFGLKPLFSRFRQPAGLIMSYLFLQFLLITYQGGWRDAAYGGRMYISVLPLFTILLALTLQAITRRWHFRWAIVTVCLFFLINFLSAASFVLFEKQVNSGLKTGLEETTLKRLENLFP